MRALSIFYNQLFSDYVKNPVFFYNICQEILNHHVPRKKKYMRGNNKHFMTKALSKTIVKCARLRYKFLRNPTYQN